MTSTTITIGIVVMLIVYLAVVFYTSRLEAKTIGGNVDEYYAGGRSIGIVRLVGTLSMSLMSAMTIVGYAPNLYRNGISYMNGIVGVFMMIGLYLPVCYRLWLLSGRYHYTSPADFFVHRYNSKGVGVLISVVYLVCIIPYISVQVGGVSKFFTATTEGKIGYWVIALVFLIVAALHSMGGGTKAVASSDAIAGWVALGTVVLLFIVCAARAFDGASMKTVADTIRTTESTKHILISNSDYNSVLGAFTIALTAGISNMTWPHFLQRAYVAKDEKTMHYTAAGIICVYLIIFGVIYFLATYVAGYSMPDMSALEAENLMALVITRFAPWLAIVFAIGVFAFGLSTTDSFMLTWVSLLQENVLHTPKEKQVQQARIWLVALTAVVIAVTYFQPPFLVTYAYSFCTPGFAQMMPALLLGLFWPKANKYGAISGIFGGVAAVLFTLLIYNPVPSIHPIIWGFALNIILIIVVSLCTPQDEKAMAEVVNPLKELFDQRKGTAFTAWCIYELICYGMFFFVLPNAGDGFLFGWMPVVMFLQWLIGFMFIASAVWYGKVRMYNKDGSTSQLNVPDRYVWTPPEETK